MFIQAAKVLLMRPQSWERFSFGPWLKQAAPRIHRNKLATTLAPISWSVLQTRGLRHPSLRGCRRSKPQPLTEFATEQQLERSDRRTLNLVAH